MAPVLLQSLEARSIHQSAAWSFPSLCDLQEGGATIGVDELKRFLILLVLLAVFFVKTWRLLQRMQSGQYAQE
jgi:hypothetical protein